MKPALSVMHAKAHSWACEVCMYSDNSVFVFSLTYKSCYRFCGVDAGSLVLVQELVKIWSNCFHICHM